MSSKFFKVKSVFSVMAGVFVLCFSTVATAQDYGSEIRLTLAEAQDFAVNHNRTVQNASIDVQKAEAARWQAIASLLPQISASADFSSNFGYQMDLGQFKISMPPSATLGITTSIGYSGASFVSLSITEISKKMADISLKKSEQEIRNQVKLLYYSALVSEETIGLLERNRESLQRLYEMSLKSVEVGTSEKTAADQIRVQVISMESSISSMKRSLEMVYNSLRIQLAVNEDVNIILAQDVDDLMSLSAMADLMAEEFDIDRNYDWRLLKENTELTKKQISMTGWSAGPTISVYHQYSEKKYFSDEVTMNMTPPNMLGVSLKVPIFTFGKTTASIKDAKLAYKKQLNTMEDTELALRVQYRQCLFNLKSALENYETQRQSVAVAEDVFDSIARKYEYGMASSLEVTNSGTSLISVQSSYVNALLDIVNAQIALEKLLNK